MAVIRAGAAPLAALALLWGTACGRPGRDLAEPERGGTVAATSDPPFPVHLTRGQVRGRSVYLEICSSCHGVDGRGDTLAVADLPDLSAKRYGALDTSQLTARFMAVHDRGVHSVIALRDVRAVLDYLPVLTYPLDTQGSAVAGRRLYARYCTSCHGVHGDGNGPAASLLDKTPSDFMKDTLVAARDYSALARVVRDGPGHAHVSSMPAWGLFFGSQMLRDVAAYLPTFQRGATAMGPSPGPPPRERAR